MVPWAGQQHSLQKVMVKVSWVLGRPGSVGRSHLSRRDPSWEGWHGEVGRQGRQQRFSTLPNASAL